MLRILGFLTVVLVLVAGCSQDSATQAEPKNSPTAPSGAVEPDSQPTVDAALAAAGKASGAAITNEQTAPGASVASKQTEQKPEPAAVPYDSATRDAVNKWLDAMGGGVAIERRAASEGLDELGEAGMPLIVAGLREGSRLQRQGAATYLIGRVSPRDEAAVKALIEALSAGDLLLCRSALQAVEKLPEEQLVKALPGLVRCAKNQEEDEVYRSRAIRAITKLGPLGAAAVEPLTALADNDTSMNVRRASFYAIVKVAPPEVAEQFCQTHLKNDQLADLRRLAAKWLATVARSDSSLTSLVAALNDPDESVRLEAVDSLVAIGKPSLPLLITALSDSEVQIRRHAALAVGKLGLLAADAVPALKTCLDDTDPQVRELANAALERLK